MVNVINRAFCFGKHWFYPFEGFNRCFHCNMLEARNDHERVCLIKHLSKIR